KSPLFTQLDAKVEALMARYRVPGVAVGVVHDGREYVRGYGVTNVDYPTRVDADTLFRIGSTTKTFTGTAMMRLVEAGKVDLAAPVRTYLPDLKLSDESVAAAVTVRQILNHSAGWLGDDYANYGRGDDALAKYVAGMASLRQLTPVGKVLAYNNAAIDLAGRVIERVTGDTYEDAVSKLVLQPLGLKRTGFFTDELVGNNIAASHVVEKGAPAVDPSTWWFPRSLDATGGLISSVRDQLRYARFHLGNGTAADGQRVMSAQTLVAMRSNPGPGGTLRMEVDGVCVTWFQRRTAQGVPIFQHGGAWGGQHSDFFFIPARGFAMTTLTNSTSGPRLINALTRQGWALEHFVGLSNPPAPVYKRSANELRAYEGRYVSWTIPPDGTPEKPTVLNVELRARDGGLRASGDLDLDISFYRGEYVLTKDADGELNRSDFIRDSGGRVVWFRDGGRLYQRQG
ncbi:MAG TPA: serine hydrolase domain-containing protein, partial [Candidatus Tumulicola sp.]|nr:serine hydrolase domain-containing protein [Candidatus Tumulicola sp.]